ncbi:hypothetical protein PGT21_015682 [Puccinia graminis f. sp. tritici]|uniref:Uncharacterized protein n=1 Tax=Puccinia graminis f. sp. tritici TaxID=56615 RepID=A0A5B0QT77_PUCGR|nr:hypothetical protein PGT21_015682 [Puccinia graminis f. sp. tritici]
MAFENLAWKETNYHDCSSHRRMVAIIQATTKYFLDYMFYKSTEDLSASKYPTSDRPENIERHLLMLRQTSHCSEHC